MAGQYTITIEQGADWSLPIGWTDADSVAVNFTGYTALIQAKDADGNVIVELSTTAGITIATTTMTVAMTDAETLDLPGGSFPYDLFVTSPGGTVTRLLAGQMDVIDTVTRA